MNLPYLGNLVEDAECYRTNGRITRVVAERWWHVAWPDGTTSVYGRQAAQQWLRPVGSARAFDVFGNIFD